MVFMDDGAAYAGAGKADHLQQPAVFCKSFEAVAGPVCDQQGLIITPGVPANAVGVVEMHVTITAATKKMEQFAGLVVMKDILGSVAVGDKYVTIGVDGGLGRNEFFRFLIDTRVK